MREVELTHDRLTVNTAISMWHGTLGPIPGWKVAFLLREEGRVTGVCTFGRPVGRLENDPGTWEHTRMALAPGRAKNTPTWFMARCRRWIREHRPDVNRLISYVDETHHTGVTYRADNWHMVYKRQVNTSRWTNRLGRTAPNASLRTKFTRAP